jgi:hypothetical protein
MLHGTLNRIKEACHYYYGGMPLLLHGHVIWIKEVCHYSYIVR